MALPDLIELCPTRFDVGAEVAIPGSKSITNRALILAALAGGETVLKGALWSEDTQVMVECLQELGFMIQVSADLGEPANRVITVYGQGGRVPRGGTEQTPVDLFVGNAGTAARFLAAFLCLGQGTYRLAGIPRMHERPQRALFSGLRQLGYRIDSPNDRLPAVIHGAGPRAGKCSVSVAESSQFASALLLVAARGGWRVEITDSHPDELPYVQMTTSLIDSFPKSGGTFFVEPDASSGSYFAGMSWLLQRNGQAGKLVVRDWPSTDWQIDAHFLRFLPPKGAISRERDLGDSILTAMVLAPFAREPVRFTELGRLRVQECERVQAIRTELTRCGARVEESGDTLSIWPGSLHQAEVETYNDHRIAMSFAMLALAVPGVRIRNPSCVKKTFPNFFQKLAAPAPFGPGVVVRDARSRAQLTGEDLFAA